MKSKVELEKLSKGYFLTIGDTKLGVENRWAITKEELVILYGLIKEELDL